MAIDRTYRCDLCRDVHPRDHFDYELIGIYWNGKHWEERQAVNVERHLCARCISAVQAFKPRCGGGFECTGGPRCSSDHK